MVSRLSLIPGLDEIVRGTIRKRRAEAARRIAELFFEGAGSFRHEHVEFFDVILRRTRAAHRPLIRADIADRLPLVPTRRILVWPARARGRDRDRRSRCCRSPVIDEKRADRDRARKGPGASAGDGRAPTLSHGSTDVIVPAAIGRGVAAPAGNAGAAFSPTGLFALITRAGQDGVLTLTIGSATTSPTIISRNCSRVRSTPFAAGCSNAQKPARQAAIRRDERYFRPDAAGRRPPRF
jgi:hypothetical protein